MTAVLNELQNWSERSASEEPLSSPVSPPPAPAEGFLSTLAQRLRTPLDSILGLSALTLETELLPEQREYLQGIREASLNLMRALTGMIDHARLKAGTLNLFPRQIEVDGLIGHIRREFSEHAQLQHTTLRCSRSQTLPRVLVGDPELLRQLLLHLLEVPLEYGSQDELHLHLEAHLKQHNRLWLHLTIDAPHTELTPTHAQALNACLRLTLPPTQTGYSDQHVMLANAGLIARMMSGEATLEHTPDQHYRIQCRIKLEYVPEAGLTADSTETLWDVSLPRETPLRVLLVEDNAVNQRLVQRILEKYGHQVRCARTGVEAIDMARTHQFDVMLLDILLPGMDGIQVAETLRAEERLRGGRLPIIAMTAHAWEEMEERCLQVGMDSFMPKPVETGRLLAVLRSVTAPNAPSSPSEPVEHIIDSTVLDADSLLLYFDHDPALIAEIAEMFMAQRTERMGHLRQFMAERDWGGLRHAALNLEAVLGTLCARSARELAQRLAEQASRRNDAEVLQTWKALSRAVERVEQALKSWLHTHQPRREL